MINRSSHAPSQRSGSTAPSTAKDFSGGLQKQVQPFSFEKIKPYSSHRSTLFSGFNLPDASTLCDPSNEYDAKLIQLIRTIPNNVVYVRELATRAHQGDAAGRKTYTLSHINTLVREHPRPIYAFFSEFDKQKINMHANGQLALEQLRAIHKHLISTLKQFPERILSFSSQTPPDQLRKAAKMQRHCLHLIYECNIFLERYQSNFTQQTAPQIANRQRSRDFIMFYDYHRKDNPEQQFIHDLQAIKNMMSGRSFYEHSDRALLLDHTQLDSLNVKEHSLLAMHHEAGSPCKIACNKVLMLESVKACASNSFLRYLPDEQARRLHLTEELVSAKSIKTLNLLHQTMIKLKPNADLMPLETRKVLYKAYALHFRSAAVNKEKHANPKLFNDACRVFTELKESLQPYLSQFRANAAAARTKNATPQPQPSSHKESEQGLQAAPTEATNANKNGATPTKPAPPKKKRATNKKKANNTKRKPSSSVNTAPPKKRKQRNGAKASKAKATPKKRQKKT